MLIASRSRRATLCVLVAYLAAHTLGALLHERLHAHAAKSVCCHGHEHAGADHRQQAHDSTAAEGRVAASGAEHDHDCVVCRVSGQPVAVVATAQFGIVSDVYPDALPSPAAAPRSLALRLAHSRAPPSAV